MKKILKFIICDLLRIHIYRNRMNGNLFSEGIDEFYMCCLCKDTKIKEMGH